MHLPHSPLHAVNHRISAFLFALVSALLLSGCGEKSVADAPAAAVATQQAVASATDDSGAIASQAVSGPHLRAQALWCHAVFW